MCLLCSAPHAAISIHSPRVGRDQIGAFTARFWPNISIHSPRVGRDDGWFTPAILLRSISIHSPRVGRDTTSSPVPGRFSDFNPLSPRGERHAGEGSMDSGDLFQSTLPAWGETGIALVPQRLQQISIHSPRVGRDTGAWWDRWRTADFNPLSPRGERLSLFHKFPVDRDFNPLSPRGERPTPATSRAPIAVFQSTLPAWGETRIDAHSCPVKGFQSTLPAWGETERARSARRKYDISIHSPRVGRD